MWAMMNAEQSLNLNRDFSVLEQKGRHAIHVSYFYHILSWFTIVWFYHDVWFWHVFTEFWHRLHWLKTLGLMPSVRKRQFFVIKILYVLLSVGCHQNFQMLNFTQHTSFYLTSYVPDMNYFIHRCFFVYFFTNPLIKIIIIIIEGSYNPHSLQEELTAHKQ